MLKTVIQRQLMKRFINTANCQGDDAPIQAHGATKLFDN